jgi:S-layer homology domain/Pentapeptide repeats (8 copies)
MRSHLKIAIALPLMSGLLLTPFAFAETVSSDSVAFEPIMEIPDAQIPGISETSQIPGISETSQIPGISETSQIPGISENAGDLNAGDLNAGDLNAGDLNAGDLNAGDLFLDQVTSVTQLSDVQPTDWAFQALQSLVERYGVIAGYPDGTFRGDRPLTRYEFAAVLNTALQQLSDLSSEALQNIVTQEDWVTLQRLQDEFSAELSTFQERVDRLERQRRTNFQQQLF